MEKVFIDGNSLSLNQFIQVVRHGTEVKLSKEAVAKVENARALVDKFVEENQVVYGITTGFGKFSDVVITGKETMDLQRNTYSKPCMWSRKSFG